MELIAVIDRRAGYAVEAQRGSSRGLYPFLRPPFMPQLCSVVKRLYGVYGFRSVYVADLDALRGRRWQHNSLVHVARCFPCVTFYVDGAFCDGRGLRVAQRRWCRNMVPVVATECLPCVSAWCRLRRLCRAPLVLSLDYRNKRLLGGTHMDKAVGLWSESVLVMDLCGIGRGGGAVSAQVMSLCQRAMRLGYSAGQIILGGGVANEEHLRQAQRLGFGGVLISSALYRGYLSAQQLKMWNQGLELGGSSV
ncbi:MAG: hypothetical protein GDA50_03955 [Alphaproteobacteria bacterium GM202ARS2]|nr:hypothetical protein [Alphaproteobacteria bacterium GM202ARS2]